MIKEHRLQFILGAKPKDHQFLFKQLDTGEATSYYEITTDNGHYHQFRLLNQTLLNKANPDVLMNVIEYRHTNSKGRELNFSWVTNIPLSKTNALKVAIGEEQDGKLRTRPLIR